jgi:hypothetical protein
MEAPHTMIIMTSDERAQLIEDINRSASIREGIVEQARLSKEFDIAAAWNELEELDESINKRVVEARLPRQRN